MENPKDNKKDNSPKGEKDKMDERVKNLFAEQDPPSYASIREVDAMKARIAELEAKLAQQEMAAAQETNVTKTPEETAASQDVSQPIETPAVEIETVVTELEEAALEPATGQFKLSSTQSWLGRAVKAGLSWIPVNLVTIIAIIAMVLVAAWSITSGSVTALFDISNQKTLSTQGILLLALAVVVTLLLGYLLARQFRTYPLRARLTASFLILTIVPLAIVGRQTYSSTYEILESQIQNEILRSSITTSSEFQDFFDAQFNTMRVQARSSELVEYLQTPETLRAGSEREALALEKLKSFAKNKSVYIMSYALVDLNGTAVLDTNKTRIGASYAGQEFFDYVKTNKTVYASGLVMLPNGDRVMYLAAPISSSGELVGVYVAALQPKYVQETIELLIRNNRGDVSQSTTEYTYVIDGDNYFVLAHSIRKDLLYKTYLSPSDPKLAKLVEQGVEQERLNRLVDYQPEVLAGLSGMTDTSIFEAPSYDGSLTQSAAVLLPDSNWIVVTARNVDTISGVIQNQTRTNVTTSIFIIAFVALFALVASRFFTRPIIELTNVAESISTGDLTKKAVVRSNDEIGVLARTFNTMTEQVQTLVSGLEKRVQDRTHDLELATDVGRAVAEKTGDLNELLIEAVELIRARYELYYTQVYLLDGAGRYLVLRAGTGEIGEALLKRGHRLAVSANSLNSRAMSSQKPVLVGDTHKNENFLPNPLLPLTRSELAIPLISNGKVVGVLDMQSDMPDTFNEANLSAFQILSGQLAVAIQNSILFNQMNEARLQVEEQSRRLTSSGWQDFLNAVERSEAIGYEFNQANVQPLADFQSVRDDHALTVPIMVSGASIGEVQIADDKTRVWSIVEAEIIEAVVSRVAQHVETLRLLAQAERYRHQAEDVSRRLTVEGWNEYFRTRKEVADGFRYDRDKVQPLNGNGDQISEATLTHPLVIHNQPVGMMMVDTQNGVDADTTELVAAVVERLGEHIENLRLLEETQEQRVQLSGALTIAKLGHWEYDLERDVFTFNDQFYSLFHTTAKQVGGYELSSAEYARLFVHPEDAPLVGKEIERALASTDRHFTAKVEHRITFPEGGIGYIAVDINLERDENGKITRWYGANQDITERKLAELTVRASEARLAEALKIAKLANWEYDVERDRFLFNDQFYSIFHTNAEQMGGYEMSSAEYAQRLVHPDDVPMVGIAIEKALSSTDKYYSTQLEHRVIYADGGIGHISVEVHIERDDQGKITRYYGANQDITDRKVAELAVRASEAKLAEALEIAKLANWEYDFERDRFLFNDQFYSLFHTTAEKAGGYELASAEYARLFVYPEDAPLVGKEIERALASTDRHFTAKVEHRITFPEGGIGYLSVDINLERDENGKITRWYGANQDITDRKLAELAVAESEKRLQSILTALPISILISRLSDGQLMYYNEAFTKLFGYQESDLIGKATPDLYYETQDRDTFFAELRKRGSLAGYELRNKHADGHLIWNLLNVFPIRYGEDDCLLIGAVDVTQRKKIEETMSKRADQLETVAVLSTTTSTVLEPDALLQEVVDLTKERFGLYHAHIYLTDDDESSLSLSAGAGKIGEEMVGKGHSISTDAEKSLVAHAFRERRAVLVNDTASQPDFLPNPLLPNTRSEMAVPMIVGDSVLGVFDVQSDVANGFTREDANIYTTLASQVAVALQNARLYVAQAATLTQLRELDRLKSAFLANMSHELRTPLNSILGFTDVMLEGLDGDLTEYMDNDLRLIQKNGRHLLHLINDVLDMAKIESGRMNLHPEMFRVHELLEEVFSITAPLASEKNLSLLIEEDSDSSIEVYADNTRIRQVMINLVNNSIKFTERGKISLSVKLIDGARALIAVKDTGIGIPQDHLESVFYEFTQVDTSTTRKVGGTGLGLPISRRLIEMHGGRLWAESTGVSGEGSTFFVELPLEAQVSDVIEKQEAEV